MRRELVRMMPCPVLSYLTQVEIYNKVPYLTLCECDATTCLCKARLAEAR